MKVKCHESQLDDFVRPPTGGPQSPLIVCRPLRSHLLVIPLRKVSGLDCPVTQKCEISGDAL